MNFRRLFAGNSLSVLSLPPGTFRNRIVCVLDGAYRRIEEK
jgi:hypothetical protein